MADFVGEKSCQPLTAVTENVAEQRVVSLELVPICLVSDTIQYNDTLLSRKQEIFIQRSYII